MIQINQFKANITSKEEELQAAFAKRYHLDLKQIKSFRILKKSIDARKKPDLFYVYSFVADLGEYEPKFLNKNKKDNNVKPYIKAPYTITKCESNSARPVVIGFGPAGMFASYALAMAGLCPIIFERGSQVDKRTQDVVRFWETGLLDTASNVQFGEGGAGTFSDGKLNTLVNDKQGRNTFVLETLVKFGAPSAIMYESKPHIGTDILTSVVSAMRQEIIRLGGQFYFDTQITDFVIDNGTLIGLKAGDTAYSCDEAVLAIGHSARDTFYRLNELGVFMEAKDFAVGFRIEHPQSMISESMYGPQFDKLPPAPYKLTTNLANGRGVYSFCMCPGGHVVNASSEANRLVVNGMSYSKRDSANANSAIVVTVGGQDYDKTNPLAALEFQRSLEEKAFSLAKGVIPQQLYGDFKAGRISQCYGDFASVTKGSTGFAPLTDIFSQEINQSLIDAIDSFGHKIKGYDRYDAILSGVESRTSSPVRINRDDSFCCNIKGLYPCGEGAGYAGGITSAAMDGLKVAEAILKKRNQ